MLDLFCGRWGWSRAFAARGWECVGVDLLEPPEVPVACRFIHADIMDLEATIAKRWKYDFICASPPCEQFSVHGLKCFFPEPPYPELGIKLFNHTRRICEESGIPYVIENVRSAQQFVGRAVNHCGPFYLWGTAVPPLMPQGITKGTKFGLDKNGTREQRKLHDPYYKTGSNRGNKVAAVYATIPPGLAACVADYATEICSQINRKENPVVRG